MNCEAIVDKLSLEVSAVSPSINFFSTHILDDAS